MDDRIVSESSLSSAELQELLDALEGISEDHYEIVDLTAQAESTPEEIEEPPTEEETPQEELPTEGGIEEVIIDDGPKIPETAITRVLDETVSRFSSADWFEKVKEKDITLAGLGGIGSWTALLLSRLKPAHLRIYDFDMVDAVNMAGQLFSNRDVGSTKAYAVSRIINTYSNYYSVIAMDEAINSESIIDPIVLCGFDNMTARKTLYFRWMRKYSGHTEAIFIDGRLSAEEFQVFCITGKDMFLMQEYQENWLFDDSEAESAPCSYKQTSFCANMIASVMTNLFVNFITNLCDPVIERALPFMTSYDASTMILRTEMQ